MYLSILATFFLLGLSSLNAALPWQSMPENFSRKKPRTTEQQYAQDAYLQSQIDQLKEDNEALKAKLQEAWSVQNELRENQQYLLFNLELEIARTGVLRQALQTTYEKWASLQKEKNIISKKAADFQELNEVREQSRMQALEYQAEIQKLQQELSIIAEAFAANQKMLHQKAFATDSCTIEKCLSMGEDIDLKDLEKANKHTQEPKDNSLGIENDEILFLTQGPSHDDLKLKEYMVQKIEETDIDDFEEDEDAPEETKQMPSESNDESLETEPINPQDSYTELPLEIVPHERGQPPVPERSPPPFVHVHPQGNVRTGFYISPKKVTNGDYQNFVKGINYKRPIQWPKGDLPSDMQDLPVVNVTYEDVFLYSVWKGKRLPNFDELQLAAEAKALSDLNDDINEWTATPVMQKATHRIFSPKNGNVEIIQENNAANDHIGFRLASDSQ